MSQINIKINEEMDQLLNYIAQKRKIAKSTLAKELLLENIQDKILPELLEEYEQGNIGLKKIMRLTGIDADRLLAKIVEQGIECPITPEIDDYTTKLTEDLINKTKLIAKK
ncbi:MAG: hypothetical protein JW776_09230 [Candidatus Lokiarchaeota archaeon]|nr:hypothetical protein [Candidatus Lokiarchaeota archaeon]